MNERTEENVIREPLHKIPHALTNGRGKVCFCLLSSRIYLEQGNKSAQKTEQDVRSLERFLKTKDEDRKIEFFSAVNLNEYIRQFIISVRTKDGTEYDYGKKVKFQLLISDFAKVRVQKDDCFPKHLCTEELLPNTIISARQASCISNQMCHNANKSWQRSTESQTDSPCGVLSIERNAWYTYFPKEIIKRVQASL